MGRREFSAQLLVNEREINKIIIDSHYEKKHSKSINDELILCLVENLNTKYYEADDVKKPYSYFVTDRIEYLGKYFKLIWLMESQKSYIGVINAYRSK